MHLRMLLRQPWIRRTCLWQRYTWQVGVVGGGMSCGVVVGTIFISRELKYSSILKYLHYFNDL